MKKRALYLFAMVMAVVFFAAPALAENVNYETAALFIEHLDEEGYHYTYQGIDDNDYDRMQMSFEGDNCDPLVNLFFADNEERCGLRRGGAACVPPFGSDGSHALLPSFCR